MFIRAVSRRTASRIAASRIPTRQLASLRTNRTLGADRSLVQLDSTLFPQIYNSSIRWFQTVSDYHKTSDETLEDIQDAVEHALEEKGIPEFEVTYASGVLTLVMPPHGTWVLNKQTPNQQIWWSSPISGPRRYEYEDDEWVFTRDDSHSMTLTQALQEELKEIYDVELDL